VDNPADLTASERAALCAWWLARNDCVTTAEMAERLALSHSGAYRLLCGLCRVLPIAQNDGRWERVSETREAD
jgi:DNA-binding IclR family transcriptional regulator